MFCNRNRNENTNRTTGRACWCVEWKQNTIYYLNLTHMSGGFHNVAIDGLKPSVRKGFKSVHLRDFRENYLPFVKGWLYSG